VIAGRVTASAYYDAVARARFLEDPTEHCPGPVLGYRPLDFDPFFMFTVRGIDAETHLVVGAGSLSFVWAAGFLVVLLGFPAGSPIPLALF
jgi:hypothetical protein